MAKKGRRATKEERLAAIQMYDNGLTADRIAEILVRYSKPHVIEKKNKPRPASYASR